VNVPAPTYLLDAGAVPVSPADRAVTGSKGANLWATDLVATGRLRAFQAAGMPGAADILVFDAGQLVATAGVI